MKQCSQSVVFLALAIAAFGVSVAAAHDKDDGPAVVPAQERVLASQQHMDGPTKNQGIKSVTPLGVIDLGSEFAQMSGRQLRARELLIEPGGVVAVHQHDQRPGVAYILEGEIVEHRNDQAAPIVRKKGEVSFEKTGVIHWWENTSGAPVRALVVDVILLEGK